MGFFASLDGLWCMFFGEGLFWEFASVFFWLTKPVTLKRTTHTTLIKLLLLILGHHGPFLTQWLRKLSEKFQTLLVAGPFQAPGSTPTKIRGQINRLGKEEDRGLPEVGRVRSCNKPP